MINLVFGLGSLVLGANFVQNNSYLFAELNCEMMAQYSKSTMNGQKWASMCSAKGAQCNSLGRKPQANKPTIVPALKARHQSQTYRSSYSISYDFKNWRNSF